MRGEDYLLQRFFSCVTEAMAPFKSLINSAQDLSSFEWATLNDLRDYAKLNQLLTRAGHRSILRDWTSCAPHSPLSLCHLIKLTILVNLRLFYILKLLLIAADCLCLGVGVYVPGACLHMGLCALFPLNTFFSPHADASALFVISLQVFIWVTSQKVTELDGSWLEVTGMFACWADRHTYLAL